MDFSVLALAGAFFSVFPFQAADDGIPDRISQTGLYADISQDEIRSENLLFEPQYPLWSDGALKRRWIFLPEGTKIQTDDFNRWIFPTGTKLWKEFTFVPADGGTRRLETRYMEKKKDGWVFATYLWDPTKSDADMAPAAGLSRYYEMSPGNFYQIPARGDCLSCHAGGNDPVLGFSGIQLSPARDEPMIDPSALDLGDLEARNLLSHTVDFNPKIPAARILDRQAIGVLHGNCMSCHRADGSAAFTGLYMDVDVHSRSAAELNVAKTAIGVASQFLIPGVGRATQRIKPGYPEQSSLFYRMNSDRAWEMMPPLGRSTRDLESLETLREWITSSE